MPMHERRHPCGGKRNLLAKWIKTDKAGLRIQMHRWSACSVVGKEAGGWGAWQEHGLASTEGRSAVFLSMQVRTRPCHLALNCWKRTIEPCFSTALTGMMLLWLNHKTVFLAGMNANPHWLNKTDVSSSWGKLPALFHTLILILKTGVPPGRGVIKWHIWVALHLFGKCACRGRQAQWSHLEEAILWKKKLTMYCSGKEQCCRHVI